MVIPFLLFIGAFEINLQGRMRHCLYAIAGAVLLHAIFLGLGVAVNAFNPSGTVNVLYNSLVCISLVGETVAITLLVYTCCLRLHIFLPLTKRIPKWLLLTPFVVLSQASMWFWIGLTIMEPGKPVISQPSYIQVRTPLKLVLYFMLGALNLIVDIAMFETYRKIREGLGKTSNSAAFSTYKIIIVVNLLSTLAETIFRILAMFAIVSAGTYDTFLSIFSNSLAVLSLAILGTSFKAAAEGGISSNSKKTKSINA